MVQLADRLGIELLASAETVAMAGGGRICTVESFPGQVDAAVVLGGDGTMLNAAHRLQGSGIPLMGLNLGDRRLPYERRGHTSRGGAGLPARGAVHAQPARSAWRASLCVPTASGPLPWTR